MLFPTLAAATPQCGGARQHHRRPRRTLWRTRRSMGLARDAVMEVYASTENGT